MIVPRQRENKGLGRAGAICAVALALCAGVTVAARIPQGEPDLRPPTPTEKAVLDHYSEVIHSVLDTFRSEDWDESVDYDVGDDVAVSSDRDVPLDINELIQRTYTVRAGSPLFDRDFKPTYDKLTATHDPAEMAAIAKTLKMNRYMVQVHFDMLRAGIKPSPKTNADLHIPGAALAYRIDPYYFDKGTSVILLFGDWKSAVWEADHDAYRYKFQHAFRQPAIENIVIQLDGSPERIDQLLHSANWQRVNDALTH